MKRDGNTVVNALFTQVLFDNGSSSAASGLMEQIEFVPKLAEKIKSDPQSVVNDLKELRKYCKLLYLISPCAVLRVLKRTIIP